MGRMAAVAVAGRMPRISATAGPVPVPRAAPVLPTRRVVAVGAVMAPAVARAVIALTHSTQVMTQPTVAPVGASLMPVG